MAYRKMTFTLPEALAGRFTRSVPARDRSKVVAQALEALLADRARRLVAACEVANSDVDLQALERDFDLLSTDISEPWSDATSRSAAR